jgi:uncharacterized protein (DUF302 family)
MTQASLVRGLGLALLIGVLGSARTTAAQEDVKLYAVQGKYEDIKTDLTTAIVNQGLTIDFTGNLAAMLKRTGADVGSTKPIYANAEYMLFCSAKLSRAMMEADPRNMAFCPYVMFVYEAAEKPGEIVIGYRRPLGGETDASKAALVEIDVLLDKIAREATE